MKIQNLKRLPRAGIIYAIRSEDIAKIQPHYLPTPEIFQLNSNNNKAISHQFSDESRDSSEVEESLESHSSKSSNKSFRNNEKLSVSITSDNFMQHLYIEKRNTKKKRKKSKRFLNTNQNSLIVQRGSIEFHTHSDNQNESSKTTENISSDSFKKSRKTIIEANPNDKIQNKYKYENNTVIPQHQDQKKKDKTLHQYKEQKEKIIRYNEAIEKDKLKHQFQETKNKLIHQYQDQTKKDNKILHQYNEQKEKDNVIRYIEPREKDKIYQLQDMKDKFIDQHQGQKDVNIMIHQYKKQKGNDRASNHNKELKEKVFNLRELKQIEYIEDSKQNDCNTNGERTISKTDSLVSTPTSDHKPKRQFLNIKERECSGDSETSMEIFQHRNDDDLLLKYEDVSMELSKLKLKYNELLLENSTTKQNSENFLMEIDNLKYENLSVKTRNETLAAKNLENQNLSRIIENLNKKLKELCSEIEIYQSKDADKTRNLIELEKAFVELKEKSSSCNVEMEHLRSQLIQKDLELKRLFHNQKVDEEKDFHIKLIHNELMELRGNIRVLCRVKPEPNNLVQILTNEALQLPPQRTKQCGPVYNFNKVFKPNSTQSEIFSEVRQLITSFVDGYNVNMITYGQSGSGKTFTMVGTKEEPGIVTHSIREVFKLCKQRTSWTFKVCLSVLEIYNETIFDLLPANQCVKPIWRKRTQIHDDGKCIHIKGLSEIEIKHEEDLLNYINKSNKIRSTCVTTQNSDSSRSHFIVMLRIYGKNLLQNCSSQGVLMLCDLAGSENCSSSLSDNSLTESKYISKSLTVLGRVFEALYNKLVVIPFRDSKLTHILKPSLSGDAKFAFIVTISGKIENLNNSVRVLNLAKKVAQISLGQPRKNTFNTVNKTIGRAELLCRSEFLS